MLIAVNHDPSSARCHNKFIPLLVLAVQVITRFVSGAGGSLTPTDAAFAGTTLVWWGSFGGILELAFADTVKSVFAHTITKNFSQGIKRTG